ncbi:unnamed protein product [Medioppia subpectinata]|uniref:Protein kinase domain-containing protein n=1 Tax=Medioppia subpectinata TaxID=1979941 RepID=A0A7R9PW02_9ACAR|nr:unnamed protein product [Medioppia subpectinata]CAG2102355.1 unnamed protein product [Medioppia subpectinata]
MVSYYKESSVLGLGCFDCKYDHTIHNELNKLTNICDKYLVQYYKIWFEDNKYYIPMELCSHSLRTVFDFKSRVFGRRSAEEFLTEFFISCQIFAELLKCVQHLHDLSPAVIHRNLKPENVLIGGKAGNLCLKLCDFGLSQVFKSLSDNRNPEYLSPEETNGGTVDYKTDVYSAAKIGKNIFDIQVTPTLSGMYSSDYKLKNSVTELQKVLISMQSLEPFDRPDCRQVLQEYTYWSINGYCLSSDGYKRFN